MTGLGGAERGWEGSGEGWVGVGTGGEGFLRRSKRRQYLPKIYLGHKKFRLFFLNRPTDRQTDRTTDRPTDRQTDIVVHREATLPKSRNMKKKVGQKALRFGPHAINVKHELKCFLNEFYLSMSFIPIF